MSGLIAGWLVTIVVACPLRGQVSDLIPPHARDSLATAERRSPSAIRERQQHLDSLTAGRRRWADAAVSEYRIQVHVDCFCISSPADSAPHLPLLTVRDGAIVAHSPGRTVGGSTLEIIVDTLFARVESDLRDPGRVVRRLELDARYGFPRDYHAETPSIPDLWLRIQVDSFAVVSATSASVGLPGTHPCDRLRR